MRNDPWARNGHDVAGNCGHRQLNKCQYPASEQERSSLNDDRVPWWGKGAHAVRALTTSEESLPDLEQQASPRMPLA